MLISMQVSLPPAQDYDVMYDNERRLGVLITQICPTMWMLKVDIWTSRHEIGQVNQNTGYVRWPYYLGLNVQTLCAQLNQVRIGTHQLQCKVIFVGRAQLWQPAVPEQWDADIGGNKIPTLTGEALQEYQAM